jgi:hypothetical protein
MEIYSLNQCPAICDGSYYFKTAYRLYKDRDRVAHRFVVVCNYYPNVLCWLIMDAHLNSLSFSLEPENMFASIKLCAQEQLCTAVFAIILSKLTALDSLFEHRGSG